MNLWLLIAAAVLPAFVIGYWIYRQDYHEPEPLSMLFRAFVCGGFSTVPAAVIQLFFKNIESPDSLIGIAAFAFGIVALTEELSKFLALRLFIYPNEEFDEPMDGIVYGVMVGLGFATVENILYVTNIESGGFGTAIGRAFTAVPAHAAFGILMGSYVGLAKFFPEKRAAFMLTGLLLAVFFHGLYDFFLLQKVYEGLGTLAIFTLIWSISMSRRLVKMGQDVSPFKKSPPFADDSSPLLRTLKPPTENEEDIRNEDLI